MTRRTGTVNSVPHPRHSEQRECPYCKAPYTNNAADWQLHKAVCVALKEEEVKMSATATQSKSSTRKAKTNKYVLTAEQKTQVKALVEQGKTYAQISLQMFNEGGGWYQAIRAEAQAAFGSVEAAKAAMKAGQPTKPAKVEAAKAAKAEAKAPVKKQAVKAEAKPDPKPAAKKAAAKKPTAKRTTPRKRTSKVAAMVESGLADSTADAKAQLADMGELAVA